jgi:hypothetical protein
MSEPIQTHYPCVPSQLDTKKYSIIIADAKIQSVTTENSVVTITGTTDFLLQGNNVSGQNVVIPDFKQSVQGSLELSDKCPTVELQSEISLEEAKRQILEYINTHPHGRTSDIIIDLCLDPALVIEALNELINEDKVEGNDVQARADQEPKTN